MSIVLPVYNGESTLARQVAELLDALADLTSQFEIVLVDDGSTDHTEEAALELAVQFPQLRVCRLPQRSGVAAAVERGLAEAEGDIVFVLDGREALRVSDVRRLWEMRHDEELIAARTTTPPTIEPRLLKQLSQWGLAVKRLAQEQDRQGGVQMIRRNALRANAPAGSGAAEVAVSEIRRTPPVRRSALAARTPTFLSHLKQLAVGE